VPARSVERRALGEKRSVIDEGGIRQPAGKQGIVTGHLFGERSGWLVFFVDCFEEFRERKKKGGGEEWRWGHPEEGKGVQGLLRRDLKRGYALEKEKKAGDDLANRGRHMEGKRNRR